MPSVSNSKRLHSPDMARRQHHDDDQRTASPPKSPTQQQPAKAAAKKKTAIAIRSGSNSAARARASPAARHYSDEASSDTDDNYRDHGEEEASSMSDSHSGGGGGYYAAAASEASGTTGTSGTSGTTAAMSRSAGLPCGLSMSVIMIMLILIPILFLVIYTAIPLDEAVKSDNFLSNHRGMITTILEVEISLMMERCDSSTLLTLQQQGKMAEYATLRVRMLVFRQEVDTYIGMIHRQLLTSDMEYRELFTSKLLGISAELKYWRGKVDLHATDGPTMRVGVRDVVDHVCNLILWIAKDPRATLLQARMGSFINGRRLESTVGGIRTAGEAMIRNESGTLVENHAEIYALKSDMMRTINLITDGGSDNHRAQVNAWWGSPLRVNFFDYVDKFLNANQTVWSSLSLPMWLKTSKFMVMEVTKWDKNLINEVQDDLHDTAVAEGMKMFGAVLACIIAAGFVTWLSRREQAHMEAMLRETRALAKAVQRFVPKNQLKTMGIRSITQVTSGMQVEVAETMVYTSIRDFSGLSAEMANSELFEWLQKYVSRMAGVVNENKGYVDTFIGDALFCIFPQPVDGVRAAIGMQVSSDQLNLELVAEGTDHMISIGCGLHYGVVVAGVFGDESRLSCTMVASDVNLASTLDRLTKPFGAKIIASPAVVGQISTDEFDIRALGPVPIGTQGAMIQIFDIYTCDPLELKNFKKLTIGAFEKAVKLIDKHPSAAAEMFEAIAIDAKLRGFHDVASERRSGKKFDDVFSTASASPAASDEQTPDGAPLEGAAAADAYSK